MLEHYWKNVGTVLLGALAAQLIPIIGALFIVRLYPPTAFGAYSAWLAVVSILAVILTLRYDNALPVEADGFQRQIAVIAVLVNSMFMMVLLLALLPILLTEIRQLVPSQSNEAMWIMLPTALLMATTTVWQGWCAADGDYKTLNNLRILLAALTVVFQVLGSLIDTTELVLSASHLAGLALSQLIYYCIKPISYRGITKKLLLQFWTRRVSFFKFSLPADLISTLTANLPILIVSKKVWSGNCWFACIDPQGFRCSARNLGKSSVRCVQEICCPKSNAKRRIYRDFQKNLLGSILQFLNLLCCRNVDRRASFFNLFWSRLASIGNVCSVSNSVIFAEACCQPVKLFSLHSREAALGYVVAGIVLSRYGFLFGVTG